ncbi:MAG: protein kinase [Candidatus Saccharimonas sp.]|nr:protein kinase [Planctomycetaceae bacterium]
MSDEELIDGVYKLVMCIATGGSSQVWEVVEQASGRHLAMKLLKSDNPDFKENKAGLKHEAEVLKSLDHPMIIKYEKYSSSRDNTYMTMEHFRAANVKLQIKSDIESVHVRARRLFESVCQALSHVHAKGWVHRDMKPDNVLMNKVGEIRLVDFSLSSKEVKGFSKMIGGGKQRTIQGTRTYIAPETINKQTPTFQTDLYSLGIMFFEVLTGKTPFQAPTPEELLRKHLRTEPPSASEFNKNVTPEMDRLIAKLLKKKPADRPASIDEVLGELRRIKIFKEDVTEESLAKKAEDGKDTLGELNDVRLDSRADAKLRGMLEANPELARQFAADKQEKAAKKKATDEHRKKQILKSSGPTKPAAAPVPVPQPMPAPMPSGYPPQGYGQYPQMPMGGPPGMPGFPNMVGNPNMPFPPQAQYGMPGMMPAMPMAPGMPPGVMPNMPAPAAPQMPATPAMPPAARGPIPAAPTASPPVQQPRPAPIATAPVPVSAPPKPVAKPTPAPAPVASKAVAPVAAKPAPKIAPPEELEFMTELPDVL